MVLPDVDFRLSSYYRLDIPLYPADAKCKHHKFDTEGRHTWCGKLLADDIDHPLMCKLGGAISRIHTAIAQLIALFCREVGWNTRLEVTVPEFIKPKPPDGLTPSEKKKWREQLKAPSHLGTHETRKWEHAIMDVVATHPFLSDEFYIDATVRHPSAVAPLRAASEPGAAAVAGENDKHVRYPPTRGKRVIPAAMETWGRLGPQFISLLQTLHAHGRRRDAAHGAPMGNYLQRWLLMLSATITRTTAKAIFDSMYAHSPSGSVLPPSAVISPDLVSQTCVSFLGQSLFPTDSWLAASRASHADITGSPIRATRRQAGVSPTLPLATDSPTHSSVQPTDSPYLPENMAYSPQSPLTYSPYRPPTPPDLALGEE
jgi:hypothetical protein